MKGKGPRFLWKTTGVLYRRNPVAFFLYLLLQIVICFGFVFFFTTVFTARSSYFEKSEGMREIRVEFGTYLPPPQAREALAQLQAETNNTIEDIYFTFGEAEESSELPKIAYRANLKANGRPVIGTAITQQMIQNREKVLVMSTLGNGTSDPATAICYPNYQINDKVTIQGEVYKIIAYTSTMLPNYLEIPYTTGVDHFYLRSMIITLPAGLSDNEKEQYGSLVSSAFQGAKVNVPPPMDQKVLSNLIIPFAASVLVGISAMLSFLYIFKYMLESAQREYTVYWLCGGRKRTLFANLLLQITVLYTLCFAVGTGLFALFRQAFVGSEFFKGTALYFSQVGILYVVSLLLLWLFSLPFLVRFSQEFKNGGTRE